MQSKADKNMNLPAFSEADMVAIHADMGCCGMAGWPDCEVPQCGNKAALPSHYCYPHTADDSLSPLGLLPRCAVTSGCRFAIEHEGACGEPAGSK